MNKNAAYLIAKDIIKQHSLTEKDIPFVIECLIDISVGNAVNQTQLTQNIYAVLQYALFMNHTFSQRKGNNLANAAFYILQNTKKETSKDGKRLELWTKYPFIRVIYDDIEKVNDDMEFKRFCDLFRERNIEDNIEHAKKQFATTFGEKADEIWFDKLREILILTKKEN